MAGFEEEYEYFRTLDPKCYSDALERHQYGLTGVHLNIEDPQTLNEKIQWLKLYDSTPIKTRLADKYLVRDFVAKTIGEEYLIPLLGVWDCFDDIDFDSLPNRFVLKANHSYNANIIVHDKALLDRNAAKTNFDFWLNENFALHHLELHYADIPPKIIAEEYLENIDGDLRDYKVLCINGKAQNILYIQDRSEAEKIAFFDCGWNKLPVTHNDIPIIEEDIPAPAQLERMVHLAETLAQGFCLVRVDFYVLNGGSIKFGEMTFTPANGQNQWLPESFNIEMGKLLKLPEEKYPLPEKTFAERGIHPLKGSFVYQEPDIQKQLEAERINNTKLQEELSILRQENKSHINQLRSIEHSVSFRLGRVLTWAPRKIKHRLFKHFI